jgi:hypothetical protein
MNLIIAAFSVTVRPKKHTGAAIFIRNGKSFAKEFHFSNSLRTRTQKCILAHALHFPLVREFFKAHPLTQGFQNYDNWATDNLSRPRKNRLQVVLQSFARILLSRNLNITFGD